MGAWEEPEEKKFTRARKGRKATAKEQYTRDTSNTVPDAVVHCIVEAIELAAEGQIKRSGVDAYLGKGFTPKEVFQKLLDKDDIEGLIALASYTILDDIHAAVHTAMAGGGIKDLEDQATREVAYAWYNSEEFKEKYSAPRAVLDEMLGA